MKVFITKICSLTLVLTLLCSGAVYAEPLNEFDSSLTDETDKEIELLKDAGDPAEDADNLALSNEGSVDLSEDPASDALEVEEDDVDSVEELLFKKNDAKGERVTDGTFNGVVNKDGTVTITGLVDPSKELEELSIPSSLAGKKVTIIDDGAFYEYRKSEKLIIPDTVISIGDLAFYCCSFCDGIKLGKNVKTIGDKAFCSCYVESLNNDKFIIPENVVIIGESAFANMLTEDNHYKLQIGKKVKAIKDRAFFNDNFEGDLIIPDSVTVIGDEAFTYSDEHSWIESRKTGSLKIGKRVKSIGNKAFKKGWFKGNLTIPDSVTTIGEEAFAECVSITGKLKLGKKLKSIGARAFYNCYFHGKLKIPDNVKHIEESTFKVDDYSYDYNDKLIGTLTIGKNVTKIGKDAFEGRPFKGSLIIPDKVRTIEEDAFRASGFSKNLRIGKSVKSIGEYAFSVCGFEGTLTISKGAKRINKYAFQDCKKIRKIVNKSNQKLRASNFLYIEYAAQYFIDDEGNRIRYGEELGKGTFIKNPVKVEDINIYESGLCIDNKKITLFRGEKCTLDAEVTPENAFNKRIKWKSSNPKIVSVSSKGVIKGLKAGTAIISATSVDGSKISEKCRVTIKKPVNVKSVKLDKVAFLDKGDTITLEPRISPSNATNKKVTWESSDPSIATVNKKGKVRGVNPGTVYITVTTVDGGKTAKCKVTVK